jgi:GAF domain-containing protein
VVQLGSLVRALSGAETVAEMARAIAETGSAPTGAEFANIAVVNAGADAAGTANLYHASSLEQEIAQRYDVIPLDDSTPLGTVMRTGGEVWLPSLPEIRDRYPALAGDTGAAGLAATASLALHDRDGTVIGAMGVAWARPQAFGDAQRAELRVVARLAADTLGRARTLEAERVSLERAERLQAIMTALVASASLDEVTAAVFRHGLPPFGAAAARLALVGPADPASLVTLGAIGLPEGFMADWESRPTSARSPSQDAIETSAAVYLATRQDLADRYPDARDALLSSGYQAWAALPLASHGRVLGVLSLAFPEPSPLDDSRDRLILAALASAVADAISRAVQHDADHDLAVSVQRSLLPKTLPDHPRVSLGACYVPAETRYGIGGDWYDAMPLPGGRILLIVGDVAGHGLDAAIAMGQLRSAARALGPAHGPAALLDGLDEFAAGGPDALSATAAVVVIDPAERTLRYSLAGHPPPLLRGPDLTVTALDGARGPLLGFGAGRRQERAVGFRPDSFLVLYTDGLVERRDEGIDVGLAWLAATFATASAADAAALCDVLIARSLPRTGRNDDRAILCAQLA